MLMQVVVARIGRAHGLKGEVSVEVRTDSPRERLAPGTSYVTEPASAGPLVIRSSRTQKDVYYLSFDGVDDRTAAEGLRGVTLVTEADDHAEEDAWYVHELVGLTAERPDGTRIGRVVDLEAMPAQDLLVIQQDSGAKARVPFVPPFVPEVDVEGGRIVLTPPYGLLDGETPEATGETAGGS